MNTKNLLVFILFGILLLTLWSAHIANNNFFNEYKQTGMCNLANKAGIPIKFVTWGNMFGEKHHLCLADVGGGMQQIDYMCAKGGPGDVSRLWIAGVCD